MKSFLYRAATRVSIGLLHGVLLLLSFSVQAIDVVDDSQRVTRLKNPAQRIISLAPHTTELLFEVGAGDKIIGVVKYSTYPPAAKNIPRVGGYKKLDLERIVGMKPDLIVAWQTGNQPAEMSRLQELGLNIFYTEPRHLQDIASLLRRLGKLTGTEQQADQAADKFMRDYHLLQTSYHNRKTLRAFYQIWDKPLMTVNDEHLISDVMKLCGLENVFGDLDNLVPRINEEAVIRADPQIIIAGGISKVKPEWKSQWQRWDDLSATRLHALIEINPDIIQRHSSRILLGAKQLCEKADEVRVHFKQ
ncbi:MAG: cobalamin-binding protein [Gammaproteobacteria bacterium]|jgi:iron complex transport system substrate-binding protein